MRRLACITLVLTALLGLAACSGDVDNSYRDNYMHNGYPGPAPRDRSR